MAMKNLPLEEYPTITPPQVTVIQPLKDDVVNGENLIVFNVEENGLFTKAEYHSPQREDAEEVVKDIPLNPLVHTHIGTNGHPIDDAMTFHFYDDAGNIAKIESWDFTIDSISGVRIFSSGAFESVTILIGFDS